MSKRVVALMRPTLAASLLTLAIPIAQATAISTLPAGISQTDWRGIADQIQSHQHQIIAGMGGYSANNVGQGWHTQFGKEGFLVTPQTGEWNWGLSLVNYSVGDTIYKPSQQPSLHSAGNRMEYGWNSNITEWMVNDQRGLEHGFTLQQRPVGNGEELHLTMQVKGNLSPVAMADGSGATFVDAQGNTVVHYEGLKVFDAKGQDIPASIKVEDGLLHVAVLDKQAVYPLTIDPWAIQAQSYIKASNTDTNDWFGRAVAVDGDTLVVGAPYESGNANLVPVSGAAYVFVRSGTSWLQQAYLKASNAGIGDYFGTAVGISGDTIVVGAHYEDSSSASTPSDNSIADSGAAYVFTRTGTTWTQQDYIKASNVDAGDHFGYRVAIDGDTLAVGADLEDSNAMGVDGNQTDNSAIDSGAVYVFTRTGTTWSQQAYVKAANTEANDQFGSAVRLDDNTLAVGAIGEDSNTKLINGDTANNAAADAGAAYVFTRDGTGTWTQQAYLKPANTGTGDWFGNSLSLDMDTLVVSAYQEDGNATGVNGDATNNSVTNSGAAYVFVRSAGVWTQQAYLKASNTWWGDMFGHSVALSGNTIVVGAIAEDSSANTVDGMQDNEDAVDAGASYIFVRNGTTWAQTAYLKAQNTDAGDYFGVAVAINGGTVVVGAHRESSDATGINGNNADNSKSESGAVYTFLTRHTVTSSVDANGSGDITPLGDQTVNYGDILVFTLAEHVGYHLDTVDGTCGGSLTGNSYTTDRVTTDCTVVAHFKINEYTVTSSQDGNSGSISPLGDQFVTHGSTTTFQVVPDVGHHIVNVDGTCGGSLSGNTYTTDLVTANCSVHAVFEINHYIVTSSEEGLGGTVTPLGPQIVDYMDTRAFQVVPTYGYEAQVGGTCGSDLGLVGTTYTINPVTSDCSVEATFNRKIYDVTSSVDASGGGTITPLGTQQVAHGTIRSFYVIPEADNSIVSPLGGTCGGTLNGNIYTTVPVVVNCTVIATFQRNQFTVIPAAEIGGSISPNAPQIVVRDSTPIFTITPDAGYHIFKIAGTCGGDPEFPVYPDNVNAVDYTTDPIGSNCTVRAVFAVNTYTVTPEAGSHGQISPSIAQTVTHGSTAKFALKFDAGYGPKAVTGSGYCPGAFKGDATYEAGPITDDCTVRIEFVSHLVTATANIHGSISPSGPQRVKDESILTFNITPDTGYSIDEVTGTCGGALTGTKYTTNTITADCTVNATFVINSYTVSTSVGEGGGTINPDIQNNVTHGTILSFTVQPELTYRTVWVIGCGTGDPVTPGSNVYETTAITGNCTVEAVFEPEELQATLTAPGRGSGGGIGLNLETQVINAVLSGRSSSFTLRADTGYHIDGVTTTVGHESEYCGGSISGDVYNTSPVFASCWATAKFLPNTYTVTPIANLGGMITLVNLSADAPVLTAAGPQTVTFDPNSVNNVVVFRIVPNTGYGILDVRGCDGGDPRDNLVENVYTTDPINRNCQVVAAFTNANHTVTPSAIGSNGSIWPSDEPQTLVHGGTISLTVTAATGYTAHVGGTCGTGTLVGTIYTTPKITKDCAVSATFTKAGEITVTPSVNGFGGGIVPSTPQLVIAGKTVTYTLVPNTGYAKYKVGGTCPTGSWNGNTWTTGAINASCTTEFSFFCDLCIPSYSSWRSVILPKN